MARKSDKKTSDVVDLLDGFAPKDVEIIKKCWEKTEKRLEETGVSVFLQFFTVYPKNLIYFPDFRNIPLENLPTEQKFRTHALKFMKAINTSVQHLGDLPSLTEHLTTLGKLHSKEHIPLEAYNELKDIVFTTLRQSSKLDSKGEKAWEQVINFVFNAIKGAMLGEINKVINAESM